MLLYGFPDNKSGSIDIALKFKQQSQDIGYNCYTYLYDILPDNITIKKEREIEYEVINSGTVATVYDVRIMDDLSFAVSPVRHQYNISAGDRINGTFTLLPDQLGTL